MHHIVTELSNYLDIYKMASWAMKILVANLVFVAADSLPAWKESKFKTLVTFGDSYTDENQLGYFIDHSGSAPPVAWDQPIVRTEFLHR